MLLSILCCSILLSSCSAWVNVHDRLNGRTIHIESLRFRSQYIHTSASHDESYKYYLDTPSNHESHIYYNCELGFKVARISEDWVTLESACDYYSDRYLAAGYPFDEERKTVMLTPCNYPEGEEAVKFKIDCESEDLTSCRFTNKRFPEMVMTHAWQKGYHTPGAYYATLGVVDDIYYKWRIVAPNPSDQQVEIFRMYNNMDAEHTYEVETTIGILNSETTSEEISQSTCVEVGGSFKAFSASASTTVSSTWEHESSTTYNKEVSKTLEVTIPPFTTLVLYQLFGNYADQFSVAAETYNATALDDGGMKSMQSFRRPMTIRIEPPARLFVPLSLLSPASKSSDQYDVKHHHQHDHYHHNKPKEL